MQMLSTLEQLSLKLKICLESSPVMEVQGNCKKGHFYSSGSCSNSLDVIITAPVKMSPFTNCCP